MGRLITATLIFVIASTPVLSQSGSSDVSFDKANFKSDKEGLKEAMKELQKGESSYKASVYSKALVHFENAQKFNPDNAELNMKIGHCYLYSSHKTEALAFLEKSISLDAPLNNFVHFLLGQAYHLNMRWDNAVKSYGEYISNASDENKEQSKLAQKKIDECNYGKELVNSPVKVDIANLCGHINT